MDLSEKDLGILTRLPISVKKRLIIERYWEQAEPRADASPKAKIIGLFFMLMIIAALATPLYAPAFSRLSNIGLVSLWFVLAISACVCLFTFVHMFYVFGTGQEDLFLERSYVTRLLPRGTLATIWFFALYGTFFALTASLGHTLTAVGVVLTCIFGLFIREFVRVSVKKVLTHLEEVNDIVVVTEKEAREFAG